MLWNSALWNSECCGWMWPIHPHTPRTQRFQLWPPLIRIYSPNILLVCPNIMQHTLNTLLCAYSSPSLVQLMHTEHIVVECTTYCSLGKNNTPYSQGFLNLWLLFGSVKHFWLFFWFLCQKFVKCTMSWLVYSEAFFTCRLQHQWCCLEQSECLEVQL